MLRITVFKKEDFGKWLKKNHATQTKVALIIHKRHTGKPFPTHRELMEEAICWGWIDTTIKRVDEDTFIRHFSRRSKNSKWSDNTLSYARALIKAGRMTPVGLEYYKAGAARPTHDHGIPKNPSLPKELKTAIGSNTKLQSALKALAPSTKRTLYRWLLRAVQPATRQKRVQVIINSLRTGKKAF